MNAPTRGEGRTAGGVATPVLLDHLLQETSRTFALTIPLLAEPSRCEVTVAYLLFRVADTLEDATLWPSERRVEELAGFERFVDDPSEGAAAALARRWLEDPPVAEQGYLELLGDLPEVTRAALDLPPDAWRIIATHTRRTARGMATFAARERDGVLELRSEEDLGTYCYAVAGIVGEMLTELFLLRDPSLAAAAGDLRRDAPAFGEALQLVNILKDAASDSGAGRRFLPPEVDRAAVFRRARRDLDVATGYCALLERHGAEGGVLGFTALPILLARATLAKVEALGPGAKISREDVAAISRRLEEAGDRGQVARLLDAARDDPR